MELPSRARVLLVVPGDAEREGLAGTLEEAGYRVAAVRTAADALREVSLAEPELVVLDPAVPDIPAAFLLAHLQQRLDVRSRVLLVTDDLGTAVRGALSGLRTVSARASSPDLLGAVREALRGAVDAPGIQGVR
jgi:DNA-binding response OmpR family regulator